MKAAILGVLLVPIAASVLGAAVAAPGSTAAAQDRVTVKEDFSRGEREVEVRRRPVGPPHLAIIGIAAAAALATTRLGVIAILVLAACTGLFVFHRGSFASRVRWIAALPFVATLGLAVWVSTATSVAASAGFTPDPSNLVQVALFFLKVGAFTIAAASR